MRPVYTYCFSALMILVVLALLMWISSWRSISFQTVELAYKNEQYKSLSLPFSHDYIGDYSIRITLDGIYSSSQSFRIYPDDEIHQLSVNGTQVSLNHLTQDQRRNYGSGFVIELDGFKPNNTNTLEFQLSNASNPAGFRIESTQRVDLPKSIFIYLALIILVFVLKRHMAINKTQTLLVVFGLAVSLVYLSKTDERTRTFDVFEGGGHKDYIEYLIEHKSLPVPGDGWEYHQPPLYYLTAALAKKMVLGDSEITGDLWGQLFALFLWTVFLVSSLASIRLAFRQYNLAIFLASFTFALWPSGIIHSIRIGNDLALYAFYSIAFFYTLKWWRNRNTETLFWASLWIAAAILTKSNGLAVAGVLGFLMLLHLYRLAKKSGSFKSPKIWRDVTIAGGFFCLALLINFADNLKYYFDGVSKDWLLSNVSEMINPGLKVSNDVKNYVIFDSATFLENPFISTWDDNYGRQYFWNFLLRSSLSSEFSFEGKLMAVWGISNGVLLLIMLFGTITYYLQRQPRLNHSVVIYRNLPWVMGLILPFVLLLAYRIKVPLSCNTDFRYIYPVLLPVLFFVFRAWCGSRLRLPRFMTLAAPLIGLNTFLWIYMLGR
jgi:hypothetical protein